MLADGKASYQYGAGLVSEVRGGVSKAYHADALGTTRAMSNSAGTVTDALETDAFGNTVSSVGSSPSPFGFAGQHGYQTDSDSGLMRLGYRFYDASVGRFISRDPIQAGYNWYTYCNNDPVNAVDPKGLADGAVENNTKKDQWAIIGIDKLDPKEWVKDDVGHWLVPADGKGKKYRMWPVINADGTNNTGHRMIAVPPGVRAGKSGGVDGEAGYDEGTEGWIKVGGGKGSWNSDGSFGVDWVGDITNGDGDFNLGHGGLGTPHDIADRARGQDKKRNR